MNSEEIRNIYRIWQDRLRKENKNEEGDNETIALPTNDAANAELKRMLIECGIPSDEATKLVYEDIDSVYYFDSKRWDIKMKDGILIKLPNKKALSALKFAVDLLSTKKFEDIKIIDTRINNQIILNE